MHELELAVMARGLGEDKGSALRIPMDKKIDSYRLRTREGLSEKEEAWMHNFWAHYRRLLSAPPGSYKTFDPKNPPERQYLVFDTETTGLNYKEDDRILQIAMILTDKWGKPLLKLSSLINPGVPISKEVSKIHGIRDEDVKDAPLFYDIWQSIEHLVRGRNLIAHKIAFDLPFLEREVERIGLQCEHVGSGCTLDGEKILYPDREKHTLGDSLRARGHEPDPARLHDALYDTEGSVVLLQDYLSQGIDPLSFEIDKEVYFRKKAMGSTKAPDGWMWKRIYREAAKLEWVDSEGKVDRTRLGKFIRKLLAKNMNELNNEDMQIIFTAFELLIAEKKEAS